MTDRNRKLIIVSNRGPYRLQAGRWVRSAGGLVAALHPLLEARGGVWVSAKHAKDFETVEAVPDLAYQLAEVSIDPAAADGFYMGVSNAILWPLLHSFPTTMRVSEAPWKDYEQANAQFAEVVLDSSGEEDTIWVQDYHLMLVPEMIRSERERAKIGWFCHIPWPPSTLFGILPWRRKILDGLLGSDLLGFHTQEYANYFLECVDKYTDYQVDRVRGTVKRGRRTVRVLAAPIGIPTEAFAELGASEEVQQQAAEIQKMVSGRRILLGVDRLDYTKGIPERIRAFELLLSRSERARKELVFVQIMVPSRTDVAAYSNLKDDIDRLVGAINGKFADTGVVPVQYFFRGFDLKTLMAHYQAADIAVVTPLRDGMNLVSHEFVAARQDDTGVLILSEFAGAAHFLRRAIQVNPYDVEALADAMEMALSMEPGEQAERMQSMRHEVQLLDVFRWADDYLSLLESS